MSDSTHPDRFEPEHISTNTCVHLRASTDLDARIKRYSLDGQPYLVLQAGGVHEATTLAVFIEDVGLLDRLIATLAQARADLVNEQLGSDLPKAG
jgi:hypothetical protein